jgi:hypothetical protein
MDPSTSQQVVAGVAAAAGLACLACHRQAPAPAPAPPPAVDDDSRPWLVLVAGEHWQTTSGKRWLGQHCSLQWIARIYDQLVDRFGRDRVRAGIKPDSGIHLGLTQSLGQLDLRLLTSYWDFQSNCWVNSSEFWVNPVKFTFGVLDCNLKAVPVVPGLQRRSSSSASSSRRWIGCAAPPTPACRPSPPASLALDVEVILTPHHALYISCVVLYTKYTGRRQDDYNVTLRLGITAEESGRRWAVREAELRAACVAMGRRVI